MIVRHHLLFATGISLLYEATSYRMQAIQGRNKRTVQVLIPSFNYCHSLYTICIASYTSAT